ncbi:Na(+)/H(+) antiporter NhaA [Methylopila jiangsuensis]|jgi:NhaA family Na+:H+ antiporter|uniref:Na(+)/H(+) antiporter NhaA n=2 Tax=Alphaproteobacteria TaxID=28211 RepID=A0A9W6JEZ7_9HYPH|nr:MULTISPECIES: Na+/H+ antiporter NhaA [Alphaproteobacteria]EKY29841.1 Na+/H+ antiporter NhaA [Brevundimonas diminuta 470-4]MRI54788.1 Na+/H+ antiporter NhaA [Methylobacterium sp. DB1607]ALR20831.1 sodium:proton antiporter [Sphingobium baderi]MDR6284103.1 NhaA family Na+:H+ antiporter [Methylopila jiangsuensis]GLK76380.1 Na(+)/H(+) antiporter NhaA [Methylopila jiangsuensis]
MASTQPVSPNRGRINSTLRQFLDNEASGGIILMGVAALAILTANSPLAEGYFAALHAYVGPLSVQHWINDALMAVFFLLVGLEIKREMLDGQLSSWSRRLLPGAAAAGGMAVPALIYIAFNLGNTAALRGWAIPAATDIAFALGVLSLLGPKVPASLKIFLAALAIIDDLGAVIVIALFYTADLSLPALAGAVLVVGALTVMNRSGVMRLWPYLILGAVLWVLVLRSGIHATLAGVILALTVPIRLTPGTPEASPSVSPLHQLEHFLQKPVAFLIVPIFGFANAGVSFAGVTPAVLIEPLTLGVAAGLVVGKLVGVFGTVAILVKARLADLPAAASWGQTLGVALLCGIGFTMSLFIGLLAFDDPALQDRAKFGILFGSLIAGLAGYFILRISNRRQASSALPTSVERKS